MKLISAINVVINALNDEGNAINKGSNKLINERERWGY